MLELKHIQVRFHGRKQDVHAVRDVSLKVSEGEVYGIVGTSGAGKSTLLRTINLLERPESGEVLIRGQNIANLDGKALRQTRLKIGMVFQHFNLAHSRTVHDNIALALRAADVSETAICHRVPELLELVELSDKEFALPGQLSGGQKQRVGIARALANNPDMLLCDEPTSALDLETTESILDLLAGINRRLGITIVIISHEMAVIKKICHRVAVMKDGEIVEENNIYELFSNPTHALTKELVEKSLDLTLPERVTDKVRGVLVRLVYRGERAEEPILADTVRDYKVHINILHGKIEYVDDRPIGILIISLDGDADNIQRALGHLKTQVARLEVIRHG
jgi:D-methionine transport system ATP-binding protein